VRISKGLAGAVIGQLPASVPVKETQVAIAACAVVAPANS
jgi:hypothetical protein